MRIMMVTDAWEPQVNGVVRTLKRTIKECTELGHEFEIVSPSDGFRTLPLITYPEIRLALFAKGKVEERFLSYEPDAVHIVTEGPLGWAMRDICLKHKMPYTTSYHTRFPEYVSARFPIPLSWGYAYVKEFHKYSGRVMVTTQSMIDELTSHGFKNIAQWSRGVDTELFDPSRRRDDFEPYKDLERPIWLNVGRVAVEKSLDEFLDLDIPGTKVIVGDGPQREELIERYPNAVFPGTRFNEELADYFANADIFVFPSKTDTFGLVNLEAMAAGIPVAAYPVAGPKDIIKGSNAGVVDEDLRTACMACLDIDKDAPRKYAEQFSWRRCGEEFIENLEPLPTPERKRFWQRFRRFRRKKTEKA